MRSITLLLCLSVVAHADTVSAQQSQDSIFVKDVLRVFASGSLVQRESMLPRVLAAKMTSKSPEVAAAIAHELEMMNAVVKQRQKNIRLGIADPTAPSIGEYVGGLTEACAHANNPVVIPALVGGMNGSLVWEALVGFGPVIIEPVAALLESEDDPLRVQGAAMTLTRLMGKYRLTDQQRSRLGRAVTARMNGRQHPVAWRGILTLALATGEPQLRQRVRAVADGVEVPPATDPRELVALKKVAQRVLTAERVQR